jgi:tRNA nucleotidyltransferase (CCA-adding enzyme)
MHMPPQLHQNFILAGQVLERLNPAGWPLRPEAFPEGTALVGGAVRDALLNRLGPRPDLDLVVNCDAIGFAKEASRRWGGTCVVLDADHGIARLVIQGWTVDLATQEGGSLEADLGRRDFTVNAIALPLEEGASLVDPTGGLDHLQRGQLVAVQEANLVADPLRLLRGLRLASELAFELEPQSQVWIERHAELLGNVAGERVLAELEKLAAAPGGHRGLQACQAMGLLKPWGADPLAQGRLQELSEQNARGRGLGTEELSWALPLARLAALFGRQALDGLRSSRRLQQRCHALRHWQTAGPSGQLSETDQLRLHQELEADLPALLLYWPEVWAKAALDRWRDPADPLFHPRPPVDGKSIQDHLGLKPSRQLGELLHHLTLERAFGRLPAAPDPPAEGMAEVWACAKRWLEQPATEERAKTLGKRKVTEKAP